MHHPAEYWPAILARPHDDGPRLAYAGWLDGRADPLGEFIRLQCALAHEGTEPDPSQEARQLDLWRRHRAAWAAGVADLVEWTSFRRGFVEEVSLTTDQMRDHADELFRRAPLQDLHLEPTDLDLDRLPAVPALGHTLFLDLSAHPLGDAGLVKLARAPFLVHVHGLNLGGCGVGDAGLQALGESPYLGRLRELYLCDNGVSDAGVRHFALSPVLERLDTLYLRTNPVTAEGLSLLRKVLGDCLHADPVDMA